MISLDFAKAIIAGNIVLWSRAQHTNVYAGRQGGHNGSTKNSTFYFTTLGPVKLSSWENSTVWKILRIKKKKKHFCLFFFFCVIILKYVKKGK